MAEKVSKMVQQVAVPGKKRGTILQGFYKRYVVLPGRKWEDLLHTYEGGAVTFKDKINTAIQTGQAGIISYIGHGGNGSLIGFPTQDHVNETGFLAEPFLRLQRKQEKHIGVRGIRCVVTSGIIM
ncbi:MAG: hypothetical protein C4295_05255 [Candidatus Fervidibacterota bacterium]